MRRLLSSLYRSIAICLAITAFLSIAGLTFAQSAGAVSPCSTWVRVIDISDNNVHPLGWQQLVKGGIAGVYIKNSEGLKYVNEFWNADTTNAKKYGLPYGGYYFAQPAKTDPTLSADFFVKSGGAQGQLPPALDLEVAGTSPAQTVQWTLTWLARVRFLTNRTPILYTGAFQSWSGSPAFSAYDLWLPAYPNGYKPVASVCALPSPRLPASWVRSGWSMWQFTSVGQPAGTHNHTDISVALPAWFGKWTGAGILTTGNGTAYPLYSTGSYGAKVVEIQNLLIKFGYLPAGSADGVFGVDTKTALEKYQKRLVIKGDGVWSQATQIASDFYLKHGYTQYASTQAKVMGAKLPTLITIDFNHATPKTTVPKKGKK